MLSQSLRHAVRHGEDGGRAEAARVSVLDPAKLVGDFRRRCTVGHSQRDHAPESVREGGSRPAGLAEHYKALAGAELVVVQGDVHGAVSRDELLGHTAERRGAAAAAGCVGRGRSGGRGGGGGSRVLVGFGP